MQYTRYHLGVCVVAVLCIAIALSQLIPEGMWLYLMLLSYGTACLTWVFTIGATDDHSHNQ